MNTERYVETQIDKTLNFETKPRDARRLENFARIVCLEISKESNKSASNFKARDWNVSKTESLMVLKLKKIKLKKQRANKISSLKTMNSRKQRIEKTNSEAIK